MPTEAFPLAFQPPRVYVLKDVWGRPQAARRAERVCAACPGAEVRTFTYDQLSDIVKEEGWETRPKMGSLAQVPPPIPILGLFRFDREAVDRDLQRMKAASGGDVYEFERFPYRLALGGGAFTFFCSDQDEIRPNPEHVCRPQWRLHQGQGCPHQCAYCSLGQFLFSHVNTEEYIEYLGQLIRQNPWQKTWLYDDVMDVLTLEPELDSLAPLMRFFESTKDYYLILHTKSDRVHGLIEANAPKNTIVAWSLSGPTQSSQLERVAGTTDSRIEAARQCQEAGIQIRYKFKPIVPVKTWRKDASYAIDQALSRTRPDNLSMTVLMWMDIEELRACIPPDLLDPEFLAAAEQAADTMRGHHIGPFPDAVRETIYRYYLKKVRARDRDIPLVISTESLAMWRTLGADLGCEPGNYVCGCGAGATPGKRVLDTNPWQDAQDARRWDGTPAVPGCD
jgi:spore photoproduct lyase-like protein